MAVAGLDLGGTKLSGAIFDGQGSIISKSLLSLENKSGAEVGALMQELTLLLLNEAAQRSLTIDVLGVCVPGIVYASTGKVWAPNIPGWAEYPLRDELLSILSGYRIRLAIDSDRACSILGEVWRGAARGCTNAVFLAVGTGIGAGLLIDGKIVRGANDIAGAAGWLALDRPYLPEYASCGCFESHASGEGISKIGKKILHDEKSYNGILRTISPETLTAHDIFKAFEDGDVVAKKTFDHCIEFWGMAAANMVSLFNPEKIIFGGGVFGPASQFIDRIKKEADKWGQPISMKKVIFEPSQLGGDAALIGAGYLASMSS